jgi:hypothetical protein
MLLKTIKIKHYRILLHKIIHALHFRHLEKIKVGKERSGINRRQTLDILQSLDIRHDDIRSVGDARLIKSQNWLRLINFMPANSDFYRRSISVIQLIFQFPPF